MTFSCITEDDYFSPPSYYELVESFGVEIIASTAEGSYNGDYFFILKRGNEYGYLAFGYGSCSGCDRLKACRSEAAVLKLRDALFNSIQWSDGKENFVEWLRDRDWQSQFSAPYEQHYEFIKRVVKELG